MSHRLALEIRGLTLRKDDTGNGEKIFNNLSLDLIDGESFGWLSLTPITHIPFIELLSGVREADNGKVSVFGSPIEKSLDHVKRFVGAVPAKLLLDERLTVVQHLTQCAQYFALDETHANDQIVELLRDFQLEGVRDQLCGELSLVNQKKLSTARALLHSPQILVVQEPFLGLGAEEISEYAKFLSLARTKVRTLLVLSSWSEGLENMFDRIALFESGKLRLLGQPKALLERYLGTHTIQLKVHGSERDYFVGKLGQKEIETVLLQEEIMIPVKGPSRGEILNEILQGSHFVYRPVTLPDLLLYLSIKDPVL